MCVGGGVGDHTWARGDPNHAFSEPSRLCLATHSRFIRFSSPPLFVTNRKSRTTPNAHWHRSRRKCRTPGGQRMYLMDRDSIGNTQPWGRVVHLTPMPRQRTGQYYTGAHDVDIKAPNSETIQVSQTIGRRHSSRSEGTRKPHQGIDPVAHKPGDKTHR